ncbi:MAG: ribonuclease D [bacterium]
MNSQNIPKPPVFVDDSAALGAAADTWASADVLAVDTEFMRTDTYFAQLALIQVSDGSHCWLIDPTGADIDLAPLKAMLVNPNTLKVFHSCSEDLEVLRTALGVIPTPLFDTQTGAAFAGMGFSKGYSALLASELAIDLGKHETRSDWLQRPLSESQLRYAAEDVLFLLPLYQKISDAIAQLGREAWVLEEMNGILGKASNPVTPGQYYQRVKGSGKLSSRQLAVLKHLCQWREEYAMLKNRPRGRVVKDRELLNLAIKAPTATSELGAAAELHPGQIRRFGNNLLSAIQAGLSVPEGQLPDPAPELLSQAQRQALKKVRQELESIAEKNGIPQGLLGNKSDLEAVVRYHFARSSDGEKAEPVSGNASIVRLLHGWRKEVAGLPLLSCLENS